MKFNRSIPFFNALLKAPVNRRNHILQAFPKFVVDDLVEVLYNVVLGRINIGSRKQHLNKHRKTLLNIVNTNNKNTRRNIIYRQKGQFLTSLIPIVLSLISKL